jgi:hypothetical protein
MVEIGLAISMASTAFNAIKRAVEVGRDVEDVAGYFGKFFDARDQISEANEYGKNQPLVKKLFSGQSVEAQALEITVAKYKIASIEKELREFLIYSGQGQFYEDMMQERRSIRQARLQQAAKKAENTKMMIDIASIVAIAGLTGGTIYIFALLV